MSSVQMARENARTTREVMPRESWEKINKLYLFLEKNISKGIKRDGRHQLLSEITGRCQELTGYLNGCMSLNESYHFMKIGTDLERADMTTRILDVGCLNLFDPEHPEIREYENLLWMNILMSLTAYQMYRQHVHHRVTGEDVGDFLLKDEKFPRAVAHCLSDMSASFMSLPNHDEPLRSTLQAQRVISEANVAKLLAKERLHDYIDEVQAELALVHNQIAGTWFNYSTN
jgi:uncharacterized alpha-E superfamily protein